MENKAIIQFTDASVHEFRVVSAQGGGRMVYAYIRDRGNPPVMYRVPLPSGTDIGQGMTLTLTGWVSGAWHWDKNTVTVAVVPYPDKLEIGGRLVG